MKRTITIGLLALVCLCAGAHTKLTPELVSFISLHGDVGYSALLHTMPDQKTASGFTPTIGADYRVYYNNFLFSFGVEAMYQVNTFAVSPFNDTIPMLDTEGNEFRMIAQVDKPRDLTHMLNINIPILFGGEWGRFYFMVGPKVSLNIYGAGSSTATFETYADYTRAYDDFHEMPNHLLATGLQMSSNTVPVKWERLNIMAHAEIGARFNHMFKHKQFRINPDKVRMYLAAYVDFGVLDMYKSYSGKNWYGYDDQGKGLQFSIRPIITSKFADNAQFRNLNVGIKYTVAFEFPQHGKSFLYDEYSSERDYRKRGGNQGYKQPY